MSADCAVIGGGVIGLTTAIELQRHGLRVVLFERQQIGRAASWAGGGILFPLFPWNYPKVVVELAQASLHLYPDLARRLQDETTYDPEFLKCGMVVLDETSIEPAQKWSRETGFPVETIDEHALRTQIPELNRERHSKSIWIRDVHQLRNPRLLKALRSYAEKVGVVIHEQTEISEVLIRNHAVEAVLTEHGRVAFPNAIICSGPWSDRLLGPCNCSVQIRPIRGQMVLLKAPAGLFSSIVVTHDHYLIPRKDGHVLVGSTIEDVGFDTEPTEDARSELLQTAHSLFPALERAEFVHHWAGLRPQSSTGLPVISPVDQVRGLYLNTAHFRNGILLAPASAVMIRHMIMRSATTLHSEPFHLPTA